MKRLKDGIRAKTKRTRGQSLSRIVEDLNPMLKGWYGYFQHAHPNTFKDVDGFVRRRLRAILRRQRKRSGSGRSPGDHQRWPNSYFHERGLFSLTAAHVSALQPSLR